MAKNYDDICYHVHFIDDGKTIELISIALVGPAGETYYAVNEELRMRRLARNSWLVQHVLPSLPTRSHRFFRRRRYIFLDATHRDVKPRAQIAKEVREFISQFDCPRLWAWYAAYGHVVLAQLYGPMMNLPPEVPMWTSDIKQLCVELGNPSMPVQHDGLLTSRANAWHNRHMLDHLRQLEASKNG